MTLSEPVSSCRKASHADKSAEPVTCQRPDLMLIGQNLDIIQKTKRNQIEQILLYFSEAIRYSTQNFIVKLSFLQLQGLKSCYQFKTTL